MSVVDILRMMQLMSHMVVVTKPFRASGNGGHLPVLEDSAPEARMSVAHKSLTHKGERWRFHTAHLMKYHARVTAPEFSLRTLSSDKFDDPLTAAFEKIQDRHSRNQRVLALQPLSNAYCHLAKTVPMGNQREEQQPTDGEEGKTTVPRTNIISIANMSSAAVAVPEENDPDRAAAAHIEERPVTDALGEMPEILQAKCDIGDLAQLLHFKRLEQSVPAERTAQILGRLNSNQIVKDIVAHPDHRELYKLAAERTVKYPIAEKVEYEERMNRIEQQRNDMTDANVDRTAAWTAQGVYQESLMDAFCGDAPVAVASRTNLNDARIIDEVTTHVEGQHAVPASQPAGALPMMTFQVQTARTRRLHTGDFSDDEAMDMPGIASKRPRIEEGRQIAIAALRPAARSQSPGSDHENGSVQSLGFSDLSVSSRVSAARSATHVERQHAVPASQPAGALPMMTFQVQTGRRRRLPTGDFSVDETMAMPGIPSKRPRNEAPPASNTGHRHDVRDSAARSPQSSASARSQAPRTARKNQ
jgi:hypothetical protein